MRKRRGGFTLIELMIVVAIVAILALLAIFGVSKFLATAKTAEATNTIGQLNKLAMAAFERESTNAQLIVGSSTAAIHALCTTSTPIPATKANIKGTKYTPNPAGDYVTGATAGSNTAGWKCLKHEMSEPQYYRYQYTKAAAVGLDFSTAPTLPGGLTIEWLAEAQGDLDGDDNTSGFVTGGSIQNQHPIAFTQIAQVDPEE